MCISGEVREHQVESRAPVHVLRALPPFSKGDHEGIITAEAELNKQVRLRCWSSRRGGAALAPATSSFSRSSERYG